MPERDSLRSRAEEAAKDALEAETKGPQRQLELLVRDILETSVDPATITPGSRPSVEVDGMHFYATANGAALVGRMPCPAPGCRNYREEVIEKLADVAKLTSEAGRCKTHRKELG